MYTQTNNVNIKPKSYLPEFHVSQNDVGRTLTAHLVSDDGDVTIPAGATVTMAGTKPSGLGYTVAGTVDGSDVSFDTDAVMTDEPGRIVSEIRIVQGDTVIGTTNVVLSVEPNPHPDDVTDGQREPLVNELTALLTSITEQADRVEEYSGKVLNMTVTAHESDEATVTKTEGEVINLDFGLPRGPQGIQGIPGEDGQDGVTPDFTIGTVETLAPGEQATATITGTEEDPVLNLGIPRGAKGDKGDTGEVSLETLAKVMISDTASGTIASFADGSDVLPAKSVLVTLNPKQSGSGTPSPDNIRPISGWDEVETYDDPAYGGTVGWNQLAIKPSRTDWSAENGVTAIYDDGVATVSSTMAGNGIYQRDYVPSVEGHKYLAGLSVKGASGQTVALSVSSTGIAKNFLPTTDNWERFDSVLSNRTTNTTRLYVFIRNNTYENVQFKNIQIIDLTAMFGTTIADEIYAMEQAQAGSGVAYFKSLFPKDYYEYNAGEETTVSAVNGDPYWKVTTPLPTTVYGGTLDVVSGVLTVTHGYISQYNGEAINEPWISDRDEYVSGTTPSSGAEVVYELATPTTIQCDPQQIQTLLGRNNVWGGSDVSIDYYADTKLYIEKMLGA